MGVCPEGLAYWACALKTLPTGCVLYRPWLLGVCSESLAYWVCALQALATGCVL